MKKLILSFAILFCWSISWSQNNSLILGSKYVPNINTPGVTLPLPTFGAINTNYWEGYKGQTANHAQNIIVDKDNKIVFFIIDQYIYSRKGKLIDVMNSSDGYVQGSVSETVVVPDAEDCNTYHLFSTQHNSGAGVSFAKGYYGKLIVNYDPNGNPLPEAGLVVDPYDNCNKMHSIREIIGDDIWDANNVHDERPMFAVPPSSGLFNFVFTTNNDRFFRLKMDQNGLVYDNYALNFNDGINPGIYPGYNVNLAMGGRREEMEAIQMPNGNFRIATQTYYEKQNTLLRYVGVAIFDLDANGNLISGSQKLVGYEITGLEYLKLIKGIELSKSGNELYIAHTKMGMHQSTVDLFDLSVPVPAMTIVSSDSKYQYSQIELATDGNMLIPSPNSLDKITGTSISTVVSGLNIPISSLNTGLEQYKVRILQDQLDQYNYSGIESSVYEDDYYTATVSATWTPNLITSLNNNPLIVGLGNTAYIQHELRIPAGVTITIQNMVFKFAPEARVIIEHSTNNLQGGKLILNNTVFTNEKRCLKDEMWLGVEVWGNQNLTQGSVNNSKQGRLIMENNSRIENALIGVLVSKRVSTTEVIPFATGDCFSQSPSFYYNQIISPFSFDDSRNGGIVRVFESVIQQNQRGIWFRKYLASSGANNLSAITKSNFVWNGPLKGNLSFQAQLIMESIKGIQVKGTNFKNTSPTSITAGGDGIGILSRQSQFFVSPYCLTVGPIWTPCSNSLASTFENLRYGMHVTNSDQFTYSVNNSEFNNCRYGIYTFGTANERILSNTFRVREASYQTAGGALYNSTGYAIQENTFYEFDDSNIPNGTGNSYGLVINNSGVVHNEVYKNTFYNLKVGGQSEKTNGVQIINQNDPLTTGLQWKCNDFKSSIYLADLGINGIIDYHQGYTDPSSLNNARNKAARNTFSLFGENALLLPQHDIMIYSGQYINYVHLADNSHTPDNVSPLVVVQPAQFNSNLVYASNNMCPSVQKHSKTILKNQLMDYKAELAVLKNKLDGGNTSNLLNIIANENNAMIIKTVLLAKSPFLSDTVLNVYLLSNSPSGMKKEVLLANSKLSNTLLSAVNQSNLPNGVKTQIQAAQAGESERTKLFREISYVNAQYEFFYNELLSRLLLDTTYTGDYSEAISLLNETNTIKSKKVLLDVHISKGDIQNANQIRNQLITEINEPDFFNLDAVKQQIYSVTAIDVALNSQPALATEVEYIGSSANDIQIKARANALLEMRDGYSEVPNFLPLMGPSAMMIQNGNETTPSANELFNVVSIYPNPSNGIMNFDFPSEDNGNMSINIYELNGKEVYSISFQNTNGERVDLSQLNKGSYLVKITIDESYTETQLIQLR